MVAEALNNYENILLAMWSLPIAVLYTISIKTDKMGNKTKEAQLAEYVMHQKEIKEALDKANSKRSR